MDRDEDYSTRKLLELERELLEPTSTNSASAYLTSSSSEENSFYDMQSLDALTVSFLQGEITLQQYESHLENQHHLRSISVIEIEASNNSEEQTVIGNSSLENRPNLESKRKRTSSTGSTSANGNKKPKDRFLNFKNILSENDDNEDEDESDETSETKSRKEISKPHKSRESLNISDDEDSDDLDDDPSNWADFDIETLDFDKFIKDHRSTNNNNNNLNKNNAYNASSDELNNRKKGMLKRKRESLHQDPVDLKAKRRRNRVLPIEIQGLMGEANLAYARGETNRAIDVCLEVIKYAPNASEPFQLLSLLYSEMGQNDKALRVGLIAAQLNKDPDEWVQLIHQAVIEGDVELVIFCYNNAIQCDPKNIQLHVERIRLLEERKDFKRLVLAKLMLLKYVDIKTHRDIYNLYFNQLMKELNDESDRNKKIYLLKTDMKKFQNQFPIERLKLLIELMMEQNSFKESITIMLDQCKIKVKQLSNQALDKSQEDQEKEDEQARQSLFESFENLNDFTFEIPPDCNKFIVALLISCLIYLDYKSEEDLFTKYLNNHDNIEDYANEYLLIADTYYNKKNYLKAKRYYHLLLVNVKEFLVQLSIWLKYGNCCNYLNETDDAINAYRNAVNLDFADCEAALALVNILLKNSIFLDEALNVIRNTLRLKKSKPLGIDTLTLMINECLIQHERNNSDEFIAASRNLLFSNFKFILEAKNINSLLRVDSKTQRAIIFHQLLEDNNYIMEFGYNKLNVQTQNTIFDIFLKLCNTLSKLKRFDELLTCSVGGTVLPIVYERMDWSKSINFTCLIACILKHDGKNAFNILKEFIVEFKNSKKLWSYVGIVIGLCPSLSQQKFFIRLSAKYMDHLPLCLINAHFAIMSGTYRYALVEYMNCFKQNPFDPFINLIIAITYCHISCQKYNTKRHLIVSQSLVFLRRYIKFRGICQESYYNVARVMHQLSLFDLAAFYYKKCLEAPCLFPEQKQVYDLTKYAAYNLVHIYKHSGSFELARQIMRKYLTI